MKTIKLISKLACMVLLCIGPNKNIKAQNYYSTSVSGPLNPSPTAMSYGKYADDPINPANGTIDVSIPIATVNDGTLSHDVSLTYHTGGIQVSELSSEIGLGWHLNAGGVISRTVKGIPDDAGDGYYHDGKWLNGSEAQTEDVAKGKKDAEPDIFYYNFAGLSGKFVFDKNKKIHCIPQSDIKINLYRSGFTFHGFMIRTPDGTKYYFGVKPFPGKVQVHSIGTKDSFIETWYLHRIVSADSKHQIDFEYTENEYAYTVSSDCYLTAYWKNSQKTCDNCVTADQVVRVKGKSLSKITTSTQTISFEHKSDREDLFAYLAPSQNFPKPKRINKINVQNGGFCYFYLLEQSYFSSNGTSYSIYDIDKRLKLDRVKKYACTGLLIEEPYIIEYFSTQFPSLLEKAIDHWGYYNAALSNNSKNDLVPYTEVKVGNQTLTYGSANRVSAENPMLQGTLKKITFPTKGSVEYTFEANEYADFQPSGVETNLFDVKSCPLVNGVFDCCDGNSNVVSERTITQYQVIQQEHINTGLLELKIEVDGPVNCNFASGWNHAATVEIYDQTLSGAFVDSYSINLVSSASNKEEFMILELAYMPGIVAGHNYKFVLTSQDGLATLKIDYVPNVQVNKLAGGLRIKEVKTHDGLTSLNDIKRTFKYELNQGFSESSGVLINRPRYGFKINDETALFSSSNIRPLSSDLGSHITYRRVLESFNGNGHNEYLLNHEKYTYNELPDYPAKTGTLLINNGTVKEKKVLDSSFKVHSKTEIEALADNYEHLPGEIFTAKSVKLRDGTCKTKYLKGDYIIRTNNFRPKKIISAVDGVETIRDIYYYSNDRVLNPQRIELRNSDGKVYKTTFKYSVDYNLPADLKNVFIHKHMIGIPFQSLSYVDNVLLDGVRTFYSNFTSDGIKTGSTETKHFPRPNIIKRFERTWKDKVLQSGTWVDEEVFARYTSDGLLSKYRRDGWSYTDYTYNADKMLTQSKYGNHQQEFEYYAGTSVLKKQTSVDGNSTSFYYDDLMRLEKEEKDCEQVVTTYTYEVNSHDIKNDKNYVETKVTFPSTSQSSLTELVSRSYMDGLGRNIQTVRRNQATGGNDFIDSQKFDKHGRVQYQYKLRESDFSDGRYVLPKADWLRNTYSYYNTPVNRVYIMKPPCWHITTYCYGKNECNDMVKINVGSGFYAAGELPKQEVQHLN